ncbi:MAG: phosphonoacetaldehyde reductase [Clostridia bacterium]|nr:phosphonoacetaldehyde reductase [Clostridia bacterium]
MPQTILIPANDYEELDAWLREQTVNRPMIVCDGAFPYLRISGHIRELEKLGFSVTYFSDFEPNPRYEAVEKGIELFREASCDAVLAVGGGSAMDVGKCVKLWARLEDDEPYYKQKPQPNGIPLLAMPTTAGTGAEATQFAVIYVNGEKHSISHPEALPQAVLMDPGALSTLPPYQRKSTMLDALCHAVESCWSVSSTEESRALATKAIRAVLAAKDGYLNNEPKGNAAMLRAAHLAGQAIQQTRTTAGHAMCYKLTTLYGLAHGHAAALCLDVLFPWMLAHPERICDPRGGEQVFGALWQIAEAMGCENAEAAAAKFHAILGSLELPKPKEKPEDYAILRTSVNVERLGNHPYTLNEEDLDGLYHRILEGQGE